MKLTSIDNIESNLNKVSEKYGTDVGNACKDVLKQIDEFFDKYKITAQYRLALGSKNHDNAGIDVGKVQLPTTLIQFLLGKAKMDKPSKGKLLGMLLKHQNFDVVMAGRNVRVKLPQNTKFND
jgi:hypothetical protein